MRVRTANIVPIARSKGEPAEFANIRKADGKSVSNTVLDTLFVTLGWLAKPDSEFAPLGLVCFPDNQSNPL
jgi:hypothetical protein